MQNPSMSTISRTTQQVVRRRLISKWPSNPAERVRLIKTALDQGWSVGIASWGIHLDRRDVVGLPQVVFGYG